VVLNKNAGTMFLAGFLLIVLIGFGVLVAAGENFTVFGGDNETNISESNFNIINDSIANETNESFTVSRTSTDPINEATENGADITILGNEIMQEPMDFDSMELLERGPDYNIYRAEDGRKIARAYPAPINYLENKEYKPINTLIVNDNCEFDYCVRKGIYYADFKESSGSKNIVKFFYNGSYISYTPGELSYISGDNQEVIAIPSSVEGYANGNEFNYPSIYGEGLDLGYEYHNSILKENLIIQDKSVLPTPSFNPDETYLSLEFLMDTKSDKLEENEIYLTGKIKKNGDEVFKKDLKWNKKDKLRIKGEARFDKSDGSFAFRLPTPYAVDANGAFIELEYVFDKKGNDLIVSVLTPYAWLVDEARAYPVKVDPSVSPGDGDTSAWIMYTNNGDNYISAFGGSLQSFHVGNDVWDGYDHYSRSYVRWSLSPSLRNELNSAQSIDSFWSTIYDVSETGGSNDTIYHHLVDQNYPTNLTPNTESEESDLFAKLRDTSYGSTILTNITIGLLSNPGVGVFNSIEFSSNEALAYIDNVLDNNEDFILSFTGLENSGVESDVEITGTGWSNEPSISFWYTQNCGNGVIDSGEACDDGDTSSGDGCSSSCSVESGYSCSGEPSTCSENIQILEIIPIQVIEDVDLVLGKRTLVRVVLKNIASGEKTVEAPNE